MSGIKRVLIAVVVFLCLFAIVFLVFISKPLSRGFDNVQDYATQKVDEKTNYNLRKTVEDTCRAYISSYEADKLGYLQYKESDSAEQRSWGEQAKMRANSTASTYNNYILKNSYVWQGNVPSDIAMELAYLD